jgi:outer membrane protein with beta-barrel domain
MPSNVCERTFPNAKRWIFRLLVLLLLAILPAHGQETPRLDAAVNYSNVRGNAAAGGGSFNLQGASASVAYNVKPWLCLVQDYGGYHFTGLAGGIDSQMYTFLFGPRYTYRREGSRWAPYGQALFGVGRLTAKQGSVTAAENGFAMAIGGGLDARISQSFSVRVVRVEYLPTRFDRAGASSATQNNVRISVGLVLSLGRRSR